MGNTNSNNKIICSTCEKCIKCNTKHENKNLIKYGSEYCEICNSCYPKFDTYLNKIYYHCYSCNSHHHYIYTKFCEECKKCFIPLHIHCNKCHKIKLSNEHCNKCDLCHTIIKDTFYCKDCNTCVDKDYKHTLNHNNILVQTIKKEL